MARNTECNAEALRTKERIVAVVDEWTARLGIEQLGFIVNHRFVNDYASDDLGPTTVAETKGDWEYRNFGVVWYLGSAARLDDDGLIGVFVHEICHVLLAPMEQNVPDKYAKLCEFAIESVTRAMRNLHQSESRAS